MASRSAGPFVGRHFLLERHFAGEMISVGKARRCPFKQVRLRCTKGGTKDGVGNGCLDTFNGHGISFKKIAMAPAMPDRKRTLQFWM